MNCDPDIDPNHEPNDDPEQPPLTIRSDRHGVTVQAPPFGYRSNLIWLIALGASLILLPPLVGLRVYHQTGQVLQTSVLVLLGVQIALGWIMLFSGVDLCSARAVLHVGPEGLSFQRVSSLRRQQTREPLAAIRDVEVDQAPFNLGRRPVHRLRVDRARGRALKIFTGRPEPLLKTARREIHARLHQLNADNTREHNAR